MRKLALMLLLLAAARASVAANWTRWEIVDRTNAFAVYADATTIRRSGDIGRMWDLSDANAGMVLAMIKQSRSFKAEREYDCSRQQLRILYISWHSENMGEGKILGSDSKPGVWQPALLGTIGERLWKIACGLDQGRHF